MIKYQLDYDKSKEVYELFKNEVKIKECYNNVFNVLTLNNTTFREGKWKVAYGYTETIPLVYCRHCFILDENNKVIDPTLFTNSEQPHRQYYVMYAFDDVDEYLNAIENDNLMPALNGYLKEYEKSAYEWAKTEGIVLIG